MNRGEEGRWEGAEKFGIVGAEERGGEVEREVEEKRGLDVERGRKMESMGEGVERGCKVESRGERAESEWEEFRREESEIEVDLEREKELELERGVRVEWVERSGVEVERVGEVEGGGDVARE